MPTLSHQVGGHDGVMADESGSLVIKPAMTREIAFYQLLASSTDPRADAEDEAGPPLTAMSVLSEVFGFQSKKSKSKAAVGASSGSGHSGGMDVRADDQQQTADGANDSKEVAGVVDQDALLFELRRFVPRFLGTLTLQGKLAEPQTAGEKGQQQQQGSVEKPLAIEPIAGAQECIVLQDLTFPFTRPCVLDVKLGQSLADETATQEKRERMDKKARETTSWETGLRLTGFQTWDHVNAKVVNTPKAYGYGITPDQLPDGMRRFFKTDYEKEESSSGAITTIPEELPTEAPDVATGADHQAQGEVMTSVDLDDDAASAGPKAADVAATSSSSQLGSTGIPRVDHLHALSRVISAALIALDRLISLFEKLEIRMVGASILIVYEGDPQRLCEAWRLADAGEARSDGLEDDELQGDDSDDESDSDEEDGEGEVMEIEVDADMPAPDLQQLIGRLKQGKLPASEEERIKLGLPPASAIWSKTKFNPLAVDLKEGGAQSTDDDDMDDDERIASDDEEDRKPRPFSLRLIDFAHTRLAHGEGPDEGLLMGMRTLRRLLQGRREEIDAAITSS